MGLYFGRSRSSFDSYDEKPLPNPNPENYEIIFSEKIGNFLVVELKYPDCTNYEGHKILVFENISMQALLKQKKIDPHFSESALHFSPVARFLPTGRGRIFAKAFCKTITKLTTEGT